jgi:predicted PurR-regulated permease PerM
VRTLEEKTFLLLTVIVTLAFAWVLWPFYGAMLWGTVVAILFAPLNRRLLIVMPHKPSLAASATIAIVLLIVIVPLVIIAIALMQEAAALVAQIQSGEINFSVYFQKVADALPIWAKSFLDRSGLANFGAVQDRLGVALTEGSQYLAGKVVDTSDNRRLSFSSALP